MDKYDSLSENFKFYEVWSGDKKLGKNSIEPPEEYMIYILTCIEQLQYVRDKINRPIIITSAWRTPEHNKAVGGTKYSYHLKGLAIDSRARGLSLFLYYSYLLKYTKFRGYGYYIWKKFIHSDLRPQFTIFKY